MVFCSFAKSLFLQLPHSSYPDRRERCYELSDLSTDLLKLEKNEAVDPLQTFYKCRISRVCYNIVQTHAPVATCSVFA